MNSRIIFGIMALIVAMSIVAATAELVFAQNKTSNMSNTTSTNKTSFAGASNPTAASKTANSTK